MLLAMQTVDDIALMASKSSNWIGL